MLKELVDVWKHRGIMIKAVDLFGEMLDDTYYIFHRSWRVFICELTVEGEKENIYSRDKEVNEKEREIRRLLMQHLIINPGRDASGCLALMSMVKDVERIGDYSKNIFDLSIMVNGATQKIRYLDTFTAMVKKIESSLKMLKSTFIDSDEKQAKKIFRHYEVVKKDCNTIMHELFKQDMEKEEALITVLFNRYLKRVNSHVTNVASGIILPLDQIDFVRGGLFE